MAPVLCFLLMLVALICGIAIGWIAHCTLTSRRIRHIDENRAAAFRALDTTDFGGAA